MNYKDNARWIWHYYKPYRVKFFVLAAVSMALTWLLTRNPGYIGQYVEEVIEQSDKTNQMRLLWVILGITMLCSFGKYIYLLMFQSMAQDVIFNIRHDLYDRIQTMDQARVKENRTGTLMSRMIGDTEGVMNFLSFGLQEIFVNIITLVIILIMMYRVNPLFFIAFLIPMPFLYSVSRHHSEAVRPGFVKIREQYARLNTVVQENIAGNRVVRAYMNEGYEFDKFDGANKGFREANLASVDVWKRFVPIIDGAGLMMSGILILVGGTLYIKSYIGMAEIVEMAAYLTLLDRPIRSFGWAVNKIEQLMASTDKIRQVMSVESALMPRNEDEEVPKVIPIATSAKWRSLPADQSIQGKIEFDHISFGYEDEPVIEDFNLTVEQGTTVALIGATGSGKSTIIDLVGRFYEVSAGEIRIDGRPVQDYDLRVLRSQLAMSLQSVFLFSDTIENNIRYGYPDADEMTVRQVAEVSGALEFISKMPRGFETVIGENGVGLSGGQKQRIALARALIKDPPILILDDTTSSVDMETEYRIHQGLKDMNNRRTTLLVAHRISSIKHADEIVVMDGGRIIERGTHRSLIKDRGYYYRVFKNQMGDFDFDVEEGRLEA